MENQIKFIESYVFPKIIAESKVLNELKFIRADISDGNSIDGFMGNIIFANLVFETKDQKLEDYLKKKKLSAKNWFPFFSTL